MQSEVELGNFSTAWKCLDELWTARRIGDDYDQALVHIECALAAGKMHSPTQAQHELSEATMLLGRTRSADPLCKHLSAQAYWMLGNLILPYSSTRQDLANTWEKSLRSLEILAKYPHPLPYEQQWYLDRCTEMRQAIAEAAISYPGRLYLQKSTLQAGSLSYLDIIHELPATSLAKPPALSSPTDFIVLQPSLDNFRIADELYHLYNLRGSSRIVPLSSKRRYLVLRVFDDAMARVGINLGDYILLEIKGRADNGDIVFASVTGSESTAVLTTYMETNGRVILQPQSTNPDHAVLEVGPHSDFGISISGIILGVFKSTYQTKSGRESSKVDEDFIPFSTEETPIPFADILQTYPIYLDIPAGAPNTLPEQSDSYLELTSFWIDGKHYYLKNLRSKERTLSLGSGEFPVIRVTGNSMNLANIDEGDYVILRRQNTAQNGDIVAAEIRGVDQTITLKRFLKRNSEVILQPESTNPVYREFRVDLSKLTPAEEQPFYIQGIALAVLKPLP
jgi:repressor LexA